MQIKLWVLGCSLPMVSALQRLLQLTLVILCSAPTVSAAPTAEPWPLWQKASATALVIDHQRWNTLLTRYLSSHPDGNGFAYDRVSEPDRQLLDEYLTALQRLDPREYNRDQQLAYWINLYNARTVALVLEHYPVDSIRDIHFGLFSFGGLGFGPWDEPLLEVAGVELSLNDVEHRIIRPLWRDPRAHYLLNCASLGCPDLWPEAIEGARVDLQLESAAIRFINQGKGIDRKAFEYSSIFHWFAEDFGGDAGVKAHLIQYAKPELARWLKPHFQQLDHRYDWRLNRAR